MAYADAQVTVGQATLRTLEQGNEFGAGEGGTFVATASPALIKNSPACQLAFRSRTGSRSKETLEKSHESSCFWASSRVIP